MEQTLGETCQRRGARYMTGDAYTAAVMCNNCCVLSLLDLDGWLGELVVKWWIWFDCLLKQTFSALMHAQANTNTCGQVLYPLFINTDTNAWHIQTYICTHTHIDVPPHLETSTVRQIFYLHLTEDMMYICITLLHQRYSGWSVLHNVIGLFFWVVFRAIARLSRLF